MILVFDRYAYIMPLFLFQEESEVPDDETVNQMLARSEEEFELYQVFAQINIFLSWWFSLASPMVYCSS